MSCAQTLPESPYIGLVPYTEQDAPFFFGREKERDIIIENLRASRLTLLYGPSGVGKSSVLNAGVTYRLHRMAHECVQEYGLPEFAVVNFRNWSDAPLTRFIQAAHESVARALQIDVIEPVPHTTLVEVLQALTERFGLELLIILDQFEENFNLRPQEKDEDGFIAQLPAAINNLNLRAKFLISLRDDSLSKLDRFKTSIPHLLDNRLSLKHMNAEGARAAIKRPIYAYNELLAPGEPKYEIEPELVDKILKEIIDSQETTAQITENEADNKMEAVRIEAVYLQLVMERLWESDKQQRILRSSTLDNMKGLKNIVQEYLNKALTEKLDVSQQDIAARIFKYLVTPSGIKIPYTKSDLHDQVEVETNELDAVLTALSQARILKNVDPPLDQPDESRYEIFHDKLAAAVLKWRSDYEQKKKLIAAGQKKEKELAEAEQKRLEAEQIRIAAELSQRRQRTIVALACLLIVFLAIAGFAGWQWQRTSELYKDLKVKSDEVDAEKVSINSLNANLREKNEELERKKMESALSKILEDDSLDDDTREAIVKILNRSDDNPKFDNPKNNLPNIPPQEDDPIARTRWNLGQTIHIRFIGGSPAVREKVEEFSKMWTKHANIKFSFDNSPWAEIRIGFDQNTSWSYFGIDALNIRKEQANMQLGILEKLKPEDEQFRRTVLHEFGHVLGLIHEHQQANANIDWNKEAVYKHFARAPYYWSRAQVDFNFFKKYSSNYRPFDPNSIMMFFTIPKAFINGDSIQPVEKLSTELSESDKELIRKLYPREEGYAR
jgi:hypothetical protein